MTTKATVAFSPSASCLFCPLPSRCPPRDICWGRGGCGLRLAASLLAGGSWTEGWACHPQEKRNRRRFKCGGGGKEREQGVHYWFLPRCSSGRTFQGYQGSLNGKWVEGGKEKNKGSFFILAVLRTHERRELSSVYVCVLELHLTCEELCWSSSAGLETSAVWEQFRTPSSCEHTCGRCALDGSNCAPAVNLSTGLGFFFSQIWNSSAHLKIYFAAFIWGSSNRTASDKKLTSKILLYMNVTCSRY